MFSKFSRRHRRPRGRGHSKLQPNDSGNTRKKKQNRKRGLELEALEPRVLLTTLIGGDIGQGGGDVFEFISANPLAPGENGDTIRLAVHGDIVVELVAADIDDQNQIVLGDVPGVLFSSGGGATDRTGLEVLGGRGGADGVTPIGETSITDPLGAPADIGAPADNNIFNAVSSSGPESNGRTFGFNVGTVNVGGEDRTLVQLVELDNDTGEGSVAAVYHQGTLSEDVMSTLDFSNVGIGGFNQITATAVSPISGDLFALHTEGGNSVLYQVNRFSGLVTEIGELEIGGNAIGQVDSLEFNAAGELFFLTTNADGDPNADAFGSINDTATANSATGTDVAIVNLGDPTLGGFDAVFTAAERQPITEQVTQQGGGIAVVEASDRYLSLVFDPADPDRVLAVAELLDDDGVLEGTVLHELPGATGASADGSIQLSALGAIEADDALIVQAAAFVQDINGNDTLVGIDHSQANDQGVVSARMVTINQANPTASLLLSEPGAVDRVFGLSSFAEEIGARPLLFSLSQDASEVIRGSAVTLPMDGESGATTVSQILAADFQPIIGSDTDGRLFFVASSGDDEIDQLFHLDVFAGSRSEVQNSLQITEGTFGETGDTDRVITAMAWDQVAADDADLVVYDSASGQLGTFGPDFANNIFQTNDTDFNVTPSIQGEGLGDAISAIAFPNDNPNAPEEFVIAVDNNNDELIRIRRVNAPTNIFVLGPLPDPDDGTDPITGADLLSLTWNPVLRNPFTGEVGVLLATDGTTDELVFVDSRPRFPNADVFHLYVTQAGEDATITAAVVPPIEDTGPRPMEPFAGPNVDPIEFRVNPAQGGTPIIITGDADTGGLLLGTRTEDLLDNVADEQIPLVSAAISSSISPQIGTRPGLNTDGSPHDVPAGLRVTENLLEFVNTAPAAIGDRLMLRNLDRIGDMAVSRDGRVFVVDTDRVNSVGEAIDGLELAEISNTTGNFITGPTLLTDATTGLPITDLMGLDFADLDRNAATGAFAETGEDLYAIAGLASPIPSVELSNAGLDLDLDGTFGELPDDLPADLTFTAMTITPGGTVFAIADVDGNPATGPVELYRIDTGAGNVLTSYQSLGEIVAADATAGDGLTELGRIFALEADPTNGALFIAAIDPATGNQTVYNLLPRSRDLDLDSPDPANPTDFEIFATELFELDADPGGGFTGVTDDVVGLAFDPNNTDVLYAALRPDGLNPGDTDTLVQFPIIGGGAGTLTPQGPAADPNPGLISVDLDGDGTADRNTFIDGMDFTDDGVLYAIDRTDDRIIVLPPFDPAVSNPLFASSSDAGTVSTDLEGYAIGSNGRFYGIGSGAGVANHVFISPEAAPSIGTIDVANATFLQIAELPTEVGRVTTMAFSPGSGSVDPDIQGLYVADTSGTIFELDLALDGTGLLDTVEGLATPGDTLEFDRDLQPGPIVLNSMDFDEAGNLFAHYTGDGTLINVDLAGDGLLHGLGTGTVFVGNEVHTSGGSLRPTVGAIAYDASSDSFLAADNTYGLPILPNESFPGPDGFEFTFDDIRESAALMRIAGTTSDAAEPEHLDRFLWGGAVTGSVQSAGSIDLFYAGWLLTGNTGGESEAAVRIFGVSAPNNFSVAGDLRHLVTLDSIGAENDTGVLAETSDPRYFSGFDLQVGGRLGSIFSADQVFGRVDVLNQADVPGLTAADLPQSEIEGWSTAGFGLRATFGDNDGDRFQLGNLHNSNGAFYNDTFDTAEQLGTIGTGVIGQEPVVQVIGNIDSGDSADFVDYYSIGLLAGQTVTVQLQASQLLNIGVFNPDGELVYTDYDHLFPGAVMNAPFQFTADRPGEWRLAVANPGDVNFNGTADGGESVSAVTLTYGLTVDGAGDIAFGGLRAGFPEEQQDVPGSETQNYWMTSPGSLINVVRGDIGGLRVFNNLIMEGGGAEILLSGSGASGNLRAIDVGQTGTGDVGAFNTIVNPSVSAADSIGYLRSNLGPLRFFGGLSAGGHLQAVEAAVDFYASVSVGGDIGVIRADSMTTPLSASSFSLNGGTIGLIDIVGDFGTALAGGPEINTGFGGNVRFINVGGEAYQSASTVTGLLAPIGEDWSPGQAVTITDDSGTQFTVRPTFDGTELEDENGDPIPEHQLTTRRYTVFRGAGSAGTVLIDVTSTSGVSVSADDLGSDGVAEIGTIFAGGLGGVVNAVDADGDGVTDEFEILPPDGIDDGGDGDIDEEDIPQLHVSINRNNGRDGIVDVYNVVGASFDSIRNNTGGSIFNVRAESVGTLSAGGFLGTIEPVAGTELIPAFVVDSDANFNDVPLQFTGTGTFPFSTFDRTGVDIAGNVIEMRAGAGIGRVLVGGSVGWITPNADLENQTGTVEGVVGAVQVNGDVIRVVTGEGIMPSGTGNRAEAGVFVGGRLQSVTNGSNPAGSDIRGDINATGGIGSISLTNSSIIRADIFSTALFEETLEFVGSASPADILPDTVDNPIPEIGRVSIRGSENPGIMGGFFLAADIGDIDVDGFGILGSQFSVSVDGTVGDIEASGYGLQLAIVQAGVNAGDIVARGDGEVLSVLDQSASARQSQFFAFDPLSGQSFSFMNDLHAFFGTSVANPTNPDGTRAGLLDTIDVAASDSIEGIRGYAMQASYGSNAVLAGDELESIRIEDSIAGLVMNVGELGRFDVGTDVVNSNLTISGPVRRLEIPGNFAGDSYLNISGTNAELRRLEVGGDMDAALNVVGEVHRVEIGGDLNGPVFIDGTNVRGEALRRFELGGSLGSRLFQVFGDVGTIEVAGDLGDKQDAELADQLMIRGNLDRLEVGVGRDSDADGSTLALDVIVLGDVDDLDVEGRVTGNVTVTGALDRFSIEADEESGIYTDPIPTRALGDLAQGATTEFDVTALAVTDADRMFAVQNDAGTFRLVEIPRLPNGNVDSDGDSFVDIGAITNGGAGADVTAIQAMEWDPVNEVLYVVGAAADFAGGEAALFSIDPATGVASPIGALRFGGVALDGTQSIRAIGLDTGRDAEDASDDTLFAVLHDNDTNPFASDTLVTVPTTAAATLALGDRGTIEIAGGIDTDIVGLDVVRDRRDARLVAISDDPTVDNDGQIIEIDADDPTQSVSISPFTSEAEGLSGYTADRFGQFYAIGNDALESQDRLLVSNFNLLEGRVSVARSIDRLEIEDGYFNGEVIVGRDLDRFDLDNGQFGPDGALISVLGDIDNVRIDDGDLHGRIVVDAGELDRLDVRGSDFSGSILARTADSIGFDGSMLRGASIDISGHLDDLEVGEDVALTATINAGSADDIEVGRDFFGSLTVGYTERGTDFEVERHFGGFASFVSDLDLTVDGNFGTDGTGTVLDTVFRGATGEIVLEDPLGDGVPDALVRVFGNAEANIDGNFTGTLVVQNLLDRFEAASVGNDLAVDPQTFTSTIAAGGGLDRFDVDGEAQRLLLQVGAAAGRDGRFNTGDARELNRMADADDIMLGALTDSIIAVGRHIDRFDLGGDMTNSSVSAGFVIDQSGLGQAAAGGVDLSVALDRDALRTTVDLYHGTMARFTVDGVMDNADATAGVDAGADGSFDDAAAGDAQTLLRSFTGGSSTIERPDVTLSNGSRLITDVAVDQRRVTVNAGSVVDVSYDVAADDLSPTNLIAGADGVLGGPGNVNGLSSIVMQDGATEEIVISAGGEQITITLRGDGTLFVLDENDPDVLNSADAVIDALVAVGTTDRTRIEVISDSDASAVSIGRILTDDDATVRSFETNVNLSGDPTNAADDQDLWFDGAVDELVVRDMSSNPSWRGRIGGEVDDLTIRTQGAGAMYIGGEVDGLELVTSTGITLLQTLSIAPAGDFSDSLRELAIHAAVNGFATEREFAFDKALGLAIIDVDPDPNSSTENTTVVNRADVLDIFTDALLSVEGLDDVETTGTILAVADALSIAPDSTLGPLAESLVGLSGLAVDSSADLDGDGQVDDRVLAVQTSELIGNLDLLSDLGDIVGLTLANDGRLLMVSDTGGGTFELIEVTRDADGDVTGTSSLGVIEDEGADLESDADDVAMADIHAVEYDPATGRTFIVGTSANTGGNQQLFVLDTTADGDADATAAGDVLIVPPGTQPLTVTQSTDLAELQDAFLSELGGLTVTSFTISPVEADYTGAARQTGIYTNPGRLFNLPDGIVISTGDVADYGEGPNTSPLNTTAYDRAATGPQETLLDQVTGGTFDHFDAVQIDIEFDLDGASDTVYFDLAFGTEEFTEFLQGARDPETGIDGFGVFLNGTNLAATEINGAPLNVDHPDMDALAGTELDGFVAPSGSPRVTFEETLGAGAAGNTLTIILGDTGDATVDTTVYLSELRGFNMPATALGDPFTALAMGQDLEDPAQRRLYAVMRDGGTEDRLLKINPDPQNIDGIIEDVEEVGAVDLGLIQAVDAAGNPVAVEVTGMDFNAQGELIATAVDAAGDEFRLLVNLENPEQSTLITQPGDDPDLFEGLTADEMSNFIGVIDNAGSNDQLVTFTGEPDRLVEINPTNGAVDHVIGTIVSANGDRYWDMIDQIAVDRDGNLFGLSSDADGINEAFGAADGYALMQIESNDLDGNGIVRATSPSLTNPDAGPVRLDTVAENAAIDPSTAPINGMAFDPFGRLFVVQRDGGTDFLRQVDLDLNLDGGVDIADFGANNGEIDLDLDRDGTPDGVGTQILGIGFDQDFNLLALSLNDGGTPGDPTDDGTELVALDFEAREIDQNESDGTLAEATETGLDNTDGTPEDGQIVVANATIGDDFASVVDDFDIYRVTLDADDVLTIDLLGGTLTDPILGVYDNAGNQLLLDDDSGRGDNARLAFDVAVDGVGAGDYFVIVAGEGSDLADPFDPTASSIISETGTYQLAIGLNAGQTGQMLRTSAPAILPATLDAFAVGAEGDPFNTYAYDTNPAGQNFGEAYVNASALNPLPIDRGPENLIGGDLGGLFDIVGAAVVRGFGADDQFFAVHDTGGGVFELIEIVRDPDSDAVDGAATAATARPIIDGRLPGPNNVLGVDAIAGDNLGRMFAVGTQGGDGPQTLYRIDPTVDTVANPTQGNAVQARVLVGDSAIIDPIVAMAFNSTNELYAAIDHGGGDQELIRINTDDGTFTRIGEIRIDGRGADLQGFDFDENDQLFAINRSEAGQRVVEIDVDEPETSGIVAREAEVNDNLRGYAADPDGRFYSIYNDMDVNAQLWQSPLDNRVATVGQIDDDPASPTFGRFSQLAALTDQDGRPLDRGVVDIAVDEGEPIGVDDADQTFFALTTDSRLFEYDAATGGFLGQFGRVVNAAGESLRLNALVVTDGADTDNDGNPDLVGFDTRFNQLVRIDPLTAVDSDGDGVNDTVTAQTLVEPGILSEFAIVDLTFDEVNGRVVGVTDDPETFVMFPADLGSIEAGGITAYAFDSVDVENPDPAMRDGNYAGRLFATTGGFDSVSMELAGQFNGEIVTPNIVDRFDLDEGDFNGTVSAGVAIERFQIDEGDFLPQAAVLTDGLLDSFSMRDRDSVFAGAISAVQADRIDIAGAALETALISVRDTADRITIDGAYEGDMELGALAGSLDIGGTLGADAVIEIADDADSIDLDNGTAPGSIVRAGGAIDRLNVDETHRGVIASGQEVDRASFEDINAGLLAVGTDADSIRVDNLTNAVISLGVNIGEDRTYNTADDEIVGGSADRIDVRGDMFDSAIAAGVLPTIDSEARANTPNLPEQLINYTGYLQSDPFGPSTFVDNAEIGGILDSGIERLSVRGTVNDSSFARSNVVAAAGPIEDIRGRHAENLLLRQYDDPFGAPEIEAINAPNNARFDVVFSEQINTDSLVMSVDANNDGDVTDPGDTIGTFVLLDQDGNVIDDVDVTYDLRGPQGVMSVTRQAGFDDLQLTIRFFGDPETDADRPIVHDHTGGRAAVRDFDRDGMPAGIEAAFGGEATTVFGEDPFGSILDGDRNDIEGGQAERIQFFQDAPNGFNVNAPVVMDSLEEGNRFDRVTVANEFSSGGDLDIYRIEGDAFDFLSLQFFSDALARMSLFVLDTNDTADPTFEQVAAWEQNLTSFNPLIRTDAGNIFQAYELVPMEAEVGGELDTLDAVGLNNNPADGIQTAGLTYFVAILPLNYNSADDNTYELTITMSQTDDELDGVDDGQFLAPPEQEDGTRPQNQPIAYISNELNMAGRGNELGFNEPKQLVYLNFAGGVSTQIDARGTDVPAPVEFEAFDISQLDAQLSGLNDFFLNGGAVGGQEVTGVLENILTIFSNTPSSTPFGGLNAQFVGADLDPFLDPNATGLFFTTVEPDVPAGVEYSTIFIGPSDIDGEAQFLGLAQQIDVANLDKGDDAVVPTVGFANVSPASDPAGKLNDYSTMLANVIAHELGHILGLNHQPTNFFDFILRDDDPDNDAATPSDANTGNGLMAYVPTPPLHEELSELGTMPLSSREFPIGSLDTVDSLLKWLGPVV